MARTRSGFSTRSRGLPGRLAYPSAYIEWLTEGYERIFDRPVIYAEGQFNPAVYDAAWLDHPLRKFEHFSMLGHPLRADMLSHMQEVLDDALVEQELAKGRQEVRDEVWEYKGESAQRIVDYLVMARDRLKAAE